MDSLIRLAAVDSTQAFLRRHPELGPCAVLAEAQTEGRGRQGNRWESAPGAGLWMSVRRPPVAGVAPGLILQRAMAAAARVLDPEGRALGLKWPNDLVGWKEGTLVKVGGIIGEQLDGALTLGLGVNLTSAPDLPDRAFPAACLADLGLTGFDIQELAEAIHESWQRLERDVPMAWHWPEAGTALTWEEGQGTCLGWEPDGRLKVATAGGVQRLSVGEVRGLTGPPGSPCR